MLKQGLRASRCGDPLRPGCHNLLSAGHRGHPTDLKWKELKDEHLLLENQAVLHLMRVTFTLDTAGHGPFLFSRWVWRGFPFQ